MVSRVKEILINNDLVCKNDIVIVGVSGGADSIALLHVLNKISKDFSFKIVVAHLNHMLRGTDSKLDEELVITLCREWGLPCFVKNCDVYALSKALKMSLEEAGRLARYDFFEQLFREHSASKIALAHHRDDKVETILYNIIRGTGTRGLKGITYCRDNHIIRPLLDFTKIEILSYCQDENLDFREDKSNLDLNFTRNKIRHDLLPLIVREYNPNISGALLRMADIISEEEDYLNEVSLELVEKNTISEDGKILLDLEMFDKQHLSLKRRMIRAILMKYFLGSSTYELKHIDSIIFLLSSSKSNAQLDFPNNLIVYKRYEKAIFTRDSLNQPPIFYEYDLIIPGETVLSEISAKITAKLEERHDFPKGNDVVHLDAEKLTGKLYIRNRKEKDWFYPLGMSGKKKLKDFFIEKKISLEKRSKIPLVFCEVDIVWVAGWQISEKYKVTDKTKKVLNLQIEYLKKTGEEYESFD